jgi:DNA-directed RNA polymerase specialized sigma24 family protein
MTDYQIIEGLKSENDKLRNQAGKVLLEKTYSQILAIAERKRETALELFRESYLALMLQIEKEDWQLKSSLIAWFCQTARFIFWKTRKDHKKMAMVDWEKIENSAQMSNDLKMNPESEMSEDELDFTLRQQAWEKLGEECKKLLLEKNQHLVDKQKPKSTWQELTKLFGANEGTLKKRAFDCREKLQKILDDLKRKFRL